MAASLATNRNLPGVCRSAVTGVVFKQIESGVDIVNDGELSKINFTAYETNRNFPSILPQDAL
jgi:hypothetical protein